MVGLRAALAEVPMVRGPASPSLETVVNVSRDRYGRVHVPERHAAASLPAVAIVDMRKERLPTGRFLSPPLVAAIEQQLQHAIDLFYAEIGGVFAPLRAFCASERRRYDPLLVRIREVEKTFGQLNTELNRDK